MKKIVSILFFLALPTFVGAQVEKSVEVIKDYVPTVARAGKLPIEPDMSDTTTLQPDIDYAITPLSMATTLTTKPIRPATVTYWEFNRPKPFYMKLGVGWPTNTVADIYATTQNSGTGYLSGYINHEGSYADIANDYNVKANSVRMHNRVGVAAGKYFGRHLVEGEVNYDNRLLHRYGMVYKDVSSMGRIPSYGINYNEFNVLVRVGDDFTDLSHTNFNIALRGMLFRDASELPYDQMYRARQTHLGVDFALARQFKQHVFRLQAMYEHGDGTRAIDGYGQDLLTVGLRYGYVGRVVDFEVGADYYYDKIVGMDSRNYLLPTLRFSTPVDKSFVPYLELDGRLRDNSLRTLSHINPYVAPYSWCSKSTVDYNLRVGIRGGVASGKLAYRFFGQVSIQENQLFWLIPYDIFSPLIIDQRHQTEFSLNGELNYKPSNRFRLMLGLHGYTYNKSRMFENALPRFKGLFEARYTAKKVSFGLRAELLGERKWSVVNREFDANSFSHIGTYSVPFTVDLGADVNWQISSVVSLFGEVRNIANSRLYDYPYYREYGVNFTAGVKLSF